MYIFFFLSFIYVYSSKHPYPLFSLCNFADADSDVNFYLLSFITERSLLCKIMTNIFYSDLCWLPNIFKEVLSNLVLNYIVVNGLGERYDQCIFPHSCLPLVSVRKRARDLFPQYNRLTIELSWMFPNKGCFPTEDMQIPPTPPPPFRQ